MPEVVKRSIPCPICASLVRESRMESHIAKQHPPSSIAECPVCRKIIKREKFCNHPIGTHAVPRNLAEFLADPRPEAVKAIDSLKTGTLKLSVAKSIKCDCGRKVVFLATDNKSLKAFDLNAFNQIISVHICMREMQSSSIRAFSGGAIDSNRRKH